MFGVSLIHVGFLAAAAAVSVPILIHLLLRPRARPASIGSLRFLKLVLKESTRRRKIRHWLLLALRTAAVLLLALLFARPYLVSTGGLGRDREVIVLVDQSASMSATFSGRTLFDCAQTAAEEILEDLPEGTAAHLAYFDERGVTANSEARVDSDRQPGYAGTDFGQALCWARDVLASSSRRHRKVFLLTDLQRTGLHRTPCKDFPADVEVEVVELGKPLMGNLAVEKVEVPQTTLRGQEPIVVTAHLSNAGAFAARNVSVRLRLESGGARQVDQATMVSIAAGSNAQVPFSVSIREPGLYQGFVEVAADDGMPGDDRRWLAFEASGADRLLLVDGEPSSSVFRNETYYLETALRLTLPGEGPAQTPYESEHLAFGAGSDLPELWPYRVVVLCNVAELADADPARLQKFVSAGGRLLIFTGRQVQPEGYAPLSRSGLLPAAVEGTSKIVGFRFQTWDKDHPVFRPLSDPQRGDLRRLMFRKITKLKPAAQSKILATTQSGDPLLVEKRLGSGTVLLFATAVDREWGNWPQARLFVPLVHQIVGYLTDRLPENQRVREAIAGPEADKPPGVTRVKRIVFVRNVDARESRIERCTQKQFCDEFQLAHAKVDDKTQQSQAALLALGAQRPDELWTYVVWILLAILAVEIFVANRTHA